MVATAPVALIISDLFFAEALRLALTRLGWRAEHADPDETALETLAAVQPRLVLVDAGAPDLDWPAVVERAKQLRPAPFILAFAGHKEEATLDRARRLGCDLVVTNAAVVSQLPKLLASMSPDEEN